MIRKHTDHHTGLIETDTAPLQNKQIFIQYFNLKELLYFYQIFSVYYFSKCTVLSAVENNQSDAVKEIK